MSGDNPVDLLFGGMEKLGPGSDADTLHVLKRLPKQQFDLVIDAGCGSGRQTLALIQELRTGVHAVDSYEPFLESLLARAQALCVEHLLHLHCLDMKDIPAVFERIDLLWSEGAAYNIGFANALTSWAPAIARGGFAVVSELSWLTERASEPVREFFQACYPDMQSVAANIATAERAGYKLLGTHTLPREAWWNGYYDILRGRAGELLHHPDAAVRQFAADTVKEIEIFERAEDSYGYVFYVLERR